MLEAGMLQAEVARRLNCNRSTITRLCQRIRLTGETHGNPRSGRPRISSLRTDRHLHLRHLRDRFLTATQTAREFGISRQTVSRRLRERGLRCRRPYRGPILTAYHRRERLRWARQHYRWRLLDWRRVIFSDESRFRVSRADGRVRLYRRLGETDQVVAAKCVAALDGGLVPILCVGETLAERESGETESVILRQVNGVMKIVGVEGIGRSIVAYEPVWAIGTGKSATAEEAEAVHKLIRNRLAEESERVGEKVRILYGGSVKPENAKALFAMKNIDGALVGGASLDANAFLAICDAAAR